MHVRRTSLDGVLVFEPKVFSDPRGFFFESYHEERFAEAGLTSRFVQDNHARSVEGTLRGLHFQKGRPQGKLVRALRGAIFDVAVDIRRGSPTFGRWVAETLSEDNQRQLYIPEGFAHGYCVVEAPAEVAYKCTDYYEPSDEGGVLWSDPSIGVQWPIRRPLLSEKDSALPVLSPDRSDLPRVKDP